MKTLKEITGVLIFIVGLILMTAKPIGVVNIMGFIMFTTISIIAIKNQNNDKGGTKETDC